MTFLTCAYLGGLSEVPLKQRALQNTVKYDKTLAKGFFASLRITTAEKLHRHTLHNKPHPAKEETPKKRREKATKPHLIIIYKREARTKAEKKEF